MDKQARRKLVVLVTDGEDLEKSGVAAARKLATNGVVVFTIGVGTAAGSEIQTVNAAGQTEWLRDADGNLVHSRLDDTTLRQIAEATGGSYYPLGALGEGLMKIGPSIRALENTNGSAAVRKNGVDRFYWLVGVMLALIVAESLIGTRRKPLTDMA
jgi:Ca-activated chloride channel family protein